ncbi:MAG: hypothetical protein HYU67_05150 [Flavobacteriia bacterium]|nr:hypothetical protein [Flavobacteriia bacterium]
MKKLLIVLLGTFCFTAESFAQKFIEGDKTLAFLSGETEFNLKFDYAGVKVGKKDESVYKAEKIAEFNKKQAGKGDRWNEKWDRSRENLYEPMFEELINKVLFKANPSIKVAKNLNSKYTIIVKTVMMEPGWNAVVAKQDPYCDFEVSWIETSSGEVKAKCFMNNVMGIVMADSDWDFNFENRMKESYAKAGKMIGKAMSKPLKVKK